MSFSRQAPRERAVRAQVAAPVRSASHEKEAALTDAERFFSAPRFSVSDEADGSESRTPLASTDGNRMATKPAGASLASGKRLASLQQALTRAMSAVKAQDLTLEEAERDRDRYAESLSIATDRAAAAEKLDESAIVPGLQAEISELKRTIEAMKESEKSSAKAREGDATADKIRVAKDRARVMEAEESATQYRELLDAATRTYDELTAEKHSLEQTVMSQASRIDRMLTQAEARKGALRTAEEMLLDSTNEMAELRRRLDEAIEDAGKAAELVRVKERERRALARKVEEADDVLSRETRALRDELERFKTDANEARSEAASLRARLDALVLERDASMGTNDAAAEELAASVVAHEAMRTELSTLNERLESASSDERRARRGEDLAPGHDRNARGHDRASRSESRGGDARRERGADDRDRDSERGMGRREGFAGALSGEIEGGAREGAGGTGEGGRRAGRGDRVGPVRREGRSRGAVGGAGHRRVREGQGGDGCGSGARRGSRERVGGGESRIRGERGCFKFDGEGYRARV